MHFNQVKDSCLTCSSSPGQRLGAPAMLKAAMDSVIEAAPPGSARGRQTPAQLVRRRRGGRSRRQLDLNISECGEPAYKVVRQEPASFMPSRLEGEGVKKCRHCRHCGQGNFGNHLESKLRLRLLLVDRPTQLICQQTNTKGQSARLFTFIQLLQLYLVQIYFVMTWKFGMVFRYQEWRQNGPKLYELLIFYWIWNQLAKNILAHVVSDFYFEHQKCIFILPQKCA